MLNEEQQMNLVIILMFIPQINTTSLKVPDEKFDLVIVDEAQDFIKIGSVHKYNY